MLCRNTLAMGAQGTRLASRLRDTHGWEEAQSKHAQQAGLAASTVANDDEFPREPTFVNEADSGQAWRSIGLVTKGFQTGPHSCSEQFGPRLAGDWSCVPADDILGIAIICHGSKQPESRQTSVGPLSSLSSCAVRMGGRSWSSVVSTKRKKNGGGRAREI